MWLGVLASWPPSMQTFPRMRTFLERGSHREWRSSGGALIESSSTSSPSVPMKKNFRAIYPDVLRPEDGACHFAWSGPAVYAHSHLERLFG